MTYDAISAACMRRLDQLSIARFGTPSLLLMERAGKGVAEAVLREVARLKRISKDPQVLIFSGKGNNGGDGLVCARYLSAYAIPTTLCIAGDRLSLKGDPLINLDILSSFQIIPIYLKTPNDLDRAVTRLRANIIVDAIFGIGFKGKAVGFYEDLINYINTSGAYTISVDVPSGLNATTGSKLGPCVEADETIAMGFSKKGFYSKSGPGHCGKINVIDIGLLGRRR